MFFGVDWLAALVKISFQIVFAIVMAIPFTIAWNHIAPDYLSFIPILYQHIPFWHMVGIILVCTYTGELIQRITPSFVRISQEVKK